jgi:heptosyltransferase-1
MNVLIVKLSSMGDIISTLPAISDARQAKPSISFDWVVEEGFAEIPRLHPAIVKVTPIALRRWRKHPFSRITIKEAAYFVKSLRSRNYDVIIDAQSLLKSALVAKIAHGDSYYGLDRQSARESLAACFYRYKFNISKQMHAVERIRMLFARSLGYQLDNTPPNYGIVLNLSTNITEKYLVFAHGSSRNNKCWQSNKWIELVLLAKASGFTVKLPWGSHEEFLRANEIAKSADNCIVLPQLSLIEMAQVISAAHGVVAVDTGLGHLTAALGTPSVSLYGPTNPNLAGTYGKNQLHLTNMFEVDAATVWQKLQGIVNKILLSPVGR